MHCLGERALFSSSYLVIFWRFLPSNAPIMLYNICYWCFFLSQGNLWTKYLVHPKIWRPKPCLLMFASLVTLDGFHLLLSIQLTADLTPDWCGGSMFHPLSHIYAKTHFCCVKTVANNALNRQRIVFFIDCEQTQHPLWTQLSHWQMFMQNGEYTAFWYLQFLCYFTQLQFTIGQNEFVEYFVFFWDNCRIWAIWAFSIICICTTIFKVSILPLNHYQAIALLEQYLFSIRKQCSINTRNSDFSIVLEICNSKLKKSRRPYLRVTRRLPFQ